LPLPKADRTDRTDLSPLLRQLADAVGVEGVLKLSRAFGGQRLYVPANPGPEHRLSKLLGHDRAIALAREFGGIRTENPMPRAFLFFRRQVYRRMLEDLAQGETQQTVASRFGVTRQFVSLLQRQCGWLRGYRPEGAEWAESLIEQTYYPYRQLALPLFCEGTRATESAMDFLLKAGRILRAVGVLATEVKEALADGELDANELTEILAQGVIPLLQVAGVVIPADVLADFDSVRMDVRDRVQGALDD
jgi:hypothetical protein